MPFFLLSRDDNDELRLLTATAAPTKQDALAELSRLTADPGFDAWDTDVVLVDLESATPVLMVRPAERTGEAPAPTIAEETEPEVEPEAETEPQAEEDTTVVAEDVYVAEADALADLVVEPLGVIPADEAEAFAAYVSPAAGVEPIEGGGEEALPVPDMARELEPEAESMLADVEPATGFAAVGSDAVVDELREALERTTAAMEEDALAEGEAEPVEPVAEAVAEKWPWDSVAQPEPSTSAAAPAVEAELEEARATVSAFLEDLEPIVSSPEPSAEAAAVESAMEAAPEPDAGLMPEPVAEPEPEPAAEPEPEPAPEPEPEPAAEAEPEFVAPEPEPVEAAVPTVDSYVCADCVYVDTCPNKDERLPRDCGSFQWK